MTYTWNYQGDNDGGNISYGTVSQNIYTFNNSGGWALIGGNRQTGTLYLKVTHNGTNDLLNFLASSHSVGLTKEEKCWPE